MSRKVNNTFQIIDDRSDIVITNYMAKQIRYGILFTR